FAVRGNWLRRKKLEFSSSYPCCNGRSGTLRPLHGPKLSRECPPRCWRRDETGKDMLGKHQQERIEPRRWQLLWRIFSQTTTTVRLSLKRPPFRRPGISTLESRSLNVCRCSARRGN